MGTEATTDIVWRVRQLIHDSAGSRWDDTEMLRWFNDGLFEIVNLKPTANSQRVSIDLVQGTIQELPQGGLLLLRITHNTGGTGIRMVDQDRLDAVEPNWRSIAETDSVEHYTYDKEIPKEFQVYPPNTGNGSVEAVVSMTPTPVANVAQLLPLDDIYIPALVDYLLYRAYSKHSKFAGNEQRAMNAYQRFAQQLGVSIQHLQAHDPNLTKVNAAGVE